MAYHWMEFDIIVRFLHCVHTVHASKHTHTHKYTRVPPSSLRISKKVCKRKIENYAFFRTKKKQYLCVCVWERNIKRKSFLNEKKQKLKKKRCGKQEQLLSLMKWKQQLQQQQNNRRRRRRKKNTIEINK